MDRRVAPRCRSIHSGYTRVVNLRRLFLLLASASLAASAAAHAQLAAYGTISVEHPSGITCREVTCGSNDGTISPIGGFGGVFYDFRNIGPVRLGVDLRAGSTVGNKNAAIYSNTPRPRIFSVLGGVRASFRTPLPQLRPYVEGAIGLAKSNISLPQESDGTVNYRSGIQYRGFAGVDLSLLPVMDFRIVELGAGGLQNFGNTYPVTSISTGLVFHLPR